MNKRGISNYVLLAIILLAFLMIGADGCQMPGGTKPTNVSSFGLSISFVESAPPTQAVVNQPFKIYVDLNNSGGQDIAAGKARLFLSGVSGNFQGIVLEKQNSALLPRKSNVFSGGSERLSFAENAKFTSSLINPFSQHFVLTSCYDYATTIETSLCIGKGNTICNITGEKIAANSNSAAPIQISSMTEQIVGNKLLIKFTIQNKGRAGEVYSSDADCSKLQTSDINEMLKKDVVKIAVTTAEQGLSCNLISEQAPYNSIQALSGNARIGQISCEKDISALSESYPTPIKIILQYKYRESRDKTISILPA